MPSNRAQAHREAKAWFEERARGVQRRLAQRGILPGALVLLFPLPPSLAGAGPGRPVQPRAIAAQAKDALGQALVFKGLAHDLPREVHLLQPQRPQHPLLPGDGPGCCPAALKLVLLTQSRPQVDFQRHGQGFALDCDAQTSCFPARPTTRR